MEYQVPSSDLSPSYPPTTDTVRTDLNGLSGERGKQTRPPPSSHRRRSSGKMPGILKRAVSSPNLGSLGPGADTSMGGDKKRNKLGYHRTAVACGHCRRRKIRCIPAYEDTTGTCQNCIRLKKDCHFFPVEQLAPLPGRRARTGSKTESQREGETSGGSSSPGVLVSSSLEQIKNVNGQMSTPPLSQNGSQLRFGALGSEARHNVISDSDGLFMAHTDKPEFVHPSDYGYSSNYDHSHRMMSYPSPALHKPDDAVSFENNSHLYYQRPSNQPMQSPYQNAPYTPYTGSMTASPQSQAYNFQKTSPESDYGWATAQPGRSMSIADTDDLRNTYAAYRSNTFPTIARRMSSTHDISRNGPEHDHMIGSDLNTPVQYQAPNMYPQMTVPSSLTWSMPGHGAPMMPATTAEVYPQPWYGSQSALPLVREEEDGGSGRQDMPHNPG